MSDPRTPGCDDSINEFAQSGGITNGAAWYVELPRKDVIFITLSQVLCGWRHAGLQLSRLQRLRDHSGARLRQVPRQLKVFGWLYNFPPSD